MYYNSTLTDLDIIFCYFIYIQNTLEAIKNEEL